MIDLSRRSLLTGAAVIGTASAFDPLPGARAAAPVADWHNAPPSPFVRARPSLSHRNAEG
jgi:hypothetical protein